MSTSFAQADASAGTMLSGVANDGTLFGHYWVANADPNEPAVGHAFICSGSTFTTFAVAVATDTFLRQASSDGRYLSGTWSDSLGGLHGFALDRQTLVLTDFAPEGSGFNIAQGVNVHGQVTGSFLRPDPASSGSLNGAFVYDLGTQTRTE